DQAILSESIRPGGIDASDLPARHAIGPQTDRGVLRRVTFVQRGRYVSRKGDQSLSPEARTNELLCDGAGIHAGLYKLYNGNRCHLQSVEPQAASRGGRSLNHKLEDTVLPRVSASAEGEETGAAARHQLGMGACSDDRLVTGSEPAGRRRRHGS